MTARRERGPALDAHDGAATPPQPVLLRTRSDQSRLVVALWGVAVLVAAAILKPWSWGTPEPTGRPAVAAAPTEVTSTPASTEDQSADGLAADFCLGAGTWQVASLETWRTQDVRVWRAVEPIADATGPMDPTIPSVPIAALRVAALGWCAPTYGPDRPIGPATVTAWFVDGGGVTDLHLQQVRPPDGATQLGALYVPFTSCPEQTICVPLLRDPVPGPWSSGRVVFRYVDEGSGLRSWLAADVQILAPEATTAPGVPTRSPAGQGG